MAAQTNSTMHGRSEERQPDIVGIILRSEEDISKKEGRIERGRETLFEIEGRIETDMDCLDLGWIGSKYPFLNSKDKGKKEGDDMNPVVEHMEKLKSDGLMSLKIRPTWKRIACMVCGSNGSATTKPLSLGKRGVQQKEIEVELNTDGNLWK